MLLSLVFVLIFVSVSLSLQEEEIVTANNTGGQHINDRQTDVSSETSTVTKPTLDSTVDNTSIRYDFVFLLWNTIDIFWVTLSALPVRTCTLCSGWKYWT